MTSVINNIKKLDQVVSVTDFGAVGDGVTDDTAAIQAALNAAKIVKMPIGIFKITSSISIPNFVTLEGAGFGTSSGTAATRILKTGSFTGIVVNVASQLKNLSVDGNTGNGGDGIQILGGRSVVKDVSSFSHGQDGFKVGGYSSQSSANTNLWRIFNVISRSNTRHGMWIAHEGKTSLPDVNAGILVGFESSFNGGDGIKISETIDNQIYGLAIQTNTGIGVHLAQYALGNYIPYSYTENNTGGGTVLDTGADRNCVFGYRAGLVNDEIVNNGADNMIIGRKGSITNIPLHKSAEGFNDIRIVEDGTSGVWKLSKEATTRNLLVELTSTSANADLVVRSTGGGVAGARFSTDTNSVAVRDLRGRTSVTLNFGTIPTSSSVDVAVTISGADSTYGYLASPQFAVPAGITWCAYWDSTASAVKVRCANSTVAGVSVSGTFMVNAFKLS